MPLKHDFVSSLLCTYLTQPSTPKTTHFTNFNSDDEASLDPRILYPSAELAVPIDFQRGNGCFQQLYWCQNGEFTPLLRADILTVFLCDQGELPASFTSWVVEKERSCAEDWSQV